MLRELRTSFSSEVPGLEMGGITLPGALCLPEGRDWLLQPLLLPSHSPPPAAGRGSPGSPILAPVHGEVLGTAMCPTASPATPQRGSQCLLINPALGY